MIIIGWICLFVAMIYFSMAYFLIALNSLGEYTIGGIKNSATKKILTLLLGLCLFTLWAYLFSEMPFSISIIND